MKEKQCTKCKEIKSVDEFFKNKNTKSGLDCSCKSCRKPDQKQYQKENKDKFNQYSKKYREENKDKIKQYRKQYYEENKDKIRQYREENKDKQKQYAKQYREENKDKQKQKNKQYLQENKDKINQYFYNRRKTDPIFKFKCNVRGSISQSFKRGRNIYTKKLSSEEILGCSIDFFREYIQSKFTKGMTFDNYGEWHLDHIIPLASAETEEEIIRLNHYRNFQPLWAFDNISKGDKINDPIQISLRV